mmetsp:Transcript_3804/g.8968  ORF Transcript_3804/g.8968 Transcript_3804/m.8968 type:complete len:200 (-) Transcript_3804:5087-5686(-)
MELNGDGVDWHGNCRVEKVKRHGNGLVRKHGLARQKGKRDGPSNEAGLKDLVAGLQLQLRPSVAVVRSSDLDGVPTRQLHVRGEGDGDRVDGVLSVGGLLHCGLGDAGEFLTVSLEGDLGGGLLVETLGLDLRGNGRASSHIGSGVLQGEGELGLGGSREGDIFGEREDNGALALGVECGAADRRSRRASHVNGAGAGR